MAIEDLFSEVNRQLTVCNSCRYCAGYCPVWPALELRRQLTDGDMTHLANLCHDCNDCFTACMYTEPHEFALNPPAVFAELRTYTYRHYAWPEAVPRWLKGRSGLILGAISVAAVLVGLAGAFRCQADEPVGSPYNVIPHALLVVLATLPVVWGAGVLLAAILRYWHDIDGSTRDLVHPLTWLGALSDGVRLKHMNGGGEGCADSPDKQPRNQRKIFHMSLAGGFLLCLASTSAAAFQQEFLGLMPPYPYLSVPVITGMVGGAGMLVGCAGLLALHAKRDQVLTTPDMAHADVTLLCTLAVLAATGMMTTFVRTTPVFSAVLVLHVGAVLLCFIIAPYTKFVHFVYRLLSLYKDRLETQRLEVTD